MLVLLFVKYVSDKYAGKKDALLDVPVGGRFSDMVALKSAQFCQAEKALVFYRKDNRRKRENCRDLLVVALLG